MKLAISGRRSRIRRGFEAGVFGVGIAIGASSAMADLDGHGPDAWRVTGVAPGDTLNARMGPGTSYPVIERFAHDERGLQQITCVPFYTYAHYEAMSEAEIKALPPRWCLMRDSQMRKAGWVAQRLITPDDTVEAASDVDDVVTVAQALVRDLYEANARAEQGSQASPLEAPGAFGYFTSDIVNLLSAGQMGAHPLFGGQDFDGRITRIAPDPDQPMLRGMVTIHVDFTNFGEPQRATYRLRADTAAAGAPLRIFMIEHEGWSYP